MWFESRPTRPSRGGNEPMGYARFDLDLNTPFDYMNARQAQEFLDLFVQQTPLRADELQRAVWQTDGSSISLDHASESSPLSAGSDVHLPDGCS